MSSSNPTPNQASNLRAYLLLTLTTACWGMNAILGRVAVGEIAPMTLVFLRWMLVVLILSVFAHRYLWRDRHILKKHFLYILTMGGFGFTTFNILFYVAAHSTTAINIGILQGAIPVFVLIGAFLVFKTRVTLLQYVGVATTIIGVIIVAAAGSFERLASFQINEGDAMMLLACALYAGYTVALRFRPNISAFSFFTVMSIAAMITSVPFVAIEISMGNFIMPTVTGWIVALLAALFASIISQIAFMTGVSLIGPGRAGVFVNLVPIFASIFAVAYLGEPFEMFHGVALALVLFGIWLSERGKPAS